MSNELKSLTLNDTKYDSFVDQTARENLGILAESAVLHTEQTLTEEQKEQARDNIGAVDESFVDDAIEDVTLCKRFDPSLFEIGTVFWQEYWGYDDSAKDTIRTKRNTTIALKAGERICCENVVALRVVLAREDGKGTALTPVGSVEKNLYGESVTIPSDGNYRLAIGEVGVSSTTVERMLSKVWIETPFEDQASTLIDDRIAALDEIVDFTPYIHNKCWVAMPNLNTGEVTSSTNRLTTATRCYCGNLKKVYFYANAGYQVIPVFYDENKVLIPDDFPWRSDFSEDVKENYKYFRLKVRKTSDAAITISEIKQVFAYGVTSTMAQKAREKVRKNSGATIPLLCVMTYNHGRWHTGTGYSCLEGAYEEFIDLQKRIIDRYSPDILCMQEHATDFTETKSANINLLYDRYDTNLAVKSDDAYAGKGISTNLGVFDTSNGNLSTDGERIWMKTYTYINGRKVAIINSHFAANVAELKIADTNAMLELLANEEYFILCVDTNADAINKTSDLYINTIKKFVDAGYKLCNGGEKGDFVTYINLNWGIDNIIVSPNINIKSVVVDTQKEYLGSGANQADHYPLIAYLEVL
jgi:endonuclease/exonuclease/phosphatase family metal-dependent hydrolase